MPKSNAIAGGFNDKGMPFALVEFDLGGKTSPQMGALLDSGASGILIAMEFAMRYLGLTREQIVDEKLCEQPFSPAGDGELIGYGRRVDLRIKGKAGNTPYLLLKNVLVYLTNKPLSKRYQVLWGQEEGFEARDFMHLRRHQKDYWRLLNESP